MEEINKPAAPDRSDSEEYIRYLEYKLAVVESALEQRNRRGSSQSSTNLLWIDQRKFVDVISNALAEKTIQGVLQRLVDGAQDLTGARAALAYYKSKPGKTDSGISDTGESWTVQSFVEFSFSDQFLDEFLALLVDSPSFTLSNLELQEYFNRWGIPFEQMPKCGLVCARLVDGGDQVCGLILVSHKVEGNFTSEDESLLVQFSALVSTGLQHINARVSAMNRIHEMQTVFNAISDAVTVFDRNGNLVRMNQAAEELVGVNLFGTSREEIIRDYSVRDSRDLPLNVDLSPSSRALQGQEVIAEKISFTNIHGKTLQISVSSSPMRDRLGNIIGAVSVHHDITDLEQIELRQSELLKENRRQKAILERLIRDVPAAICVLDGSEYRLSLVNPAFTGLMGQASEELIGQTFSEIAQFHKNQLLPLLDNVYRWGETIHSIDFPLKQNPESGKPERFFNFSLTPLFDEDGRVESILALVQEVTEQSLAHRKIEDERKLMQTIIENAPAGIVVVDREGHILVANQMAEKLYGRKIDVGDACGKTSNLNIHQVGGIPYPPQEMPLIKASCSGQSFQDEEVLFILPDGERRNVQGNIAPIRDQEGELQGAVGIFRDITEQRKAEEKLRRSDTLIRRLVESNLLAIAFHCEEGMICEVNDAFLRLTGYSRADFEKGNLFIEDLIPPELIDLETQALDEIRENGSSGLYEAEYIRKDGSRIPVLTGFAKLDDKPIEYIRFAVDILDRKQAEVSLAYQALLLENVHDAIVACDRNCLITAWNKAAEMMYGWKADEVLGKPFFDIIQMEFSSNNDFSWLESLLKDGFYQADATQNRKDGSKILVEISVIVLRDTRGEPVGYLSANRDITGRKNAEVAVKQYAQRLERSNKDLEDFAFVVSHDLQEPLRKIEAFSGLLQKHLDINLDPESVDYLERMQKAANRMKRMIQDLLAYSRVSTKAKPFSPVDLNQVVKEVIADLEIRIQICEGQVQVGELPVIDADDLQMRQLLQNLIANALKFHRPNVPPEVRITSRLLESSTNTPDIICSPVEKIEICVEDNGIGFEQEFEEQIFMPFQRLNAKSDFDGSGIGLAICRKIVDRHQGEIRAEGRPGEGAVFKVVLPVQQFG